MDEVLKFLKDCWVYYLATVEWNQPRVRPFGRVNVFENKLYIQTWKTKNVSKQIQANNNVEICAFNGKKWVRVTGKLIRDERKEIKKEMLDRNPELRGMYSEEDDNTEVLYFKDATATISSFTEEPKVYNF